ncbi:hypothetical protein [Lactococcus lactis]
MVEKLYAKWKKSASDFEIIDSDTALDLKSKAIIITSPKEKAVIFDMETDLAVRPVKGRKSQKSRGLSYFSFYPGETSPLRGVARLIEWSDELKIFLEAFENISKFQIKEFGRTPVIIFPEKMEKLKVLETSKGRVILKFLVKIEQTIPYSWGYQYNGYLGLEFVFAGHPTPKKKVGLEQEGISLFEAEAKFPKWMVIPEDLTDRKEVEKLVKEVRKVYQERDYHLLGKFVNEKVTFSDYQEKYRTLKHYEEEIESLKKEIFELNSKIEDLKKKKEKQRQWIDKEKEDLLEYQSKNEYYKSLEIENRELSFEKSDLLSKVDLMEEEILQLKNRSLWNRIRNKT